jgi:hypothetical protein
MSQDWRKLSFTTDEIMSGALSRLGYTFRSRYLQNGMPKGAAILDNGDPVNIMNVPSSYHYYLSPQATRLLPDFVTHYNASPCEEPAINESSYVWGDEAYFHAERVRRMSQAQSGG